MDDITVLVNKDNPINIDYIPQNLVEVKNPYYECSFGDCKLEMVDFVRDAFNALVSVAKEDGFTLYADSAYRPFWYQQKILDYYINERGEEAYKKVALPGTSEHQLGLAIDLASLENGQYIDELTDDMLVTKWVHENCAKFGFILRYPKGKENITGYSYEPWHIRFVGKDLAEELTASNMTLEEYKLKRGREK